MADEDPKPQDPMTRITDGAVRGVGEFLGRICLPAAEEFGMLLQDRVRHWRIKNFVNIARTTEALIDQIENEKAPAVHPRILHRVYEEGSWSDSNELQDMWAGLLATACYEDGTDKSLIYVDTLSKISHKEALLLDYVGRNCEWRITWTEQLVEALPVFPDPGTLRDIMKLESFEDIDEAISHLELLGLVENHRELTSERFEPYDAVEADPFDWEESGADGQWHNNIELSLTGLGVRLFLKVQGIEKRPSEFVRAKIAKTAYRDTFNLDL